VSLASRLLAAVFSAGGVIGAVDAPLPQPATTEQTAQNIKLIEDRIEAVTSTGTNALAPRWDQEAGNVEKASRKSGWPSQHLQRWSAIANRRLSFA